MRTTGDGASPAGRCAIRPSTGELLLACCFTTCILTWPDTPMSSSASWFPTSPSGLTLVTGVITLGAMQQMVRAFGRVESSFQYLVNSWITIVELISVYKG